MMIISLCAKYNFYLSALIMKNFINMKPLFTTILLLLLICCKYSHAQKKAEPLVSDVLKPAQIVSVHGHIGEKLDQSYKNRVLAQNIDDLIEPFRHPYRNAIMAE